MQIKSILLASAFATLSINVYSYTCFSITYFCFLKIFAITFGIFIALIIHIVLSSTYKTGIKTESTYKELEAFRNKILYEYQQSPNDGEEHLPVVLGRTLDGLLQQLLDYILRDFINCYLEQYSYQSQLLINNMKQDMWGAIQVLQERMSRIDHAKLIACDLVTEITSHFEVIRESQTMSITNNRLIFKISPQLKTTESELNYLRHLSELLIMFLLPRSYSLSPGKYFLREILACKVLYPAIDTITDPDCFNRHIIEYIESQKALANMQGITFKSANSFEEYLKNIQKTDNIDALKKYRYEIVTKIMQATTLQNIKRSKGVDADINKLTNSSGISKSEMNAAKKLKKYIEQLMFAKKECEKRMTDLGWNTDYNVKNILPLLSILDNVTGRKYLSKYLETVSSQGLVGYWTAAEELRVAHRKNWHQLGAEIFYTYIRNPSAEIKVDKNTRKRVESFLLGDKGPEVFYEIQQQVVQTIEDKYYQSFVNSDYYNRMLKVMNRTDSDEVDHGQINEDKGNGDSVVIALDSSLNVGDHSNYAKKKLDQLQEKLNNKNQALQALRSSLKPDSMVLGILEKEVEWLQGERRQLEAHLTRTEVWGENLGKWRAVVQSADVLDEKEQAQFVIVVDMIEDNNTEIEEEISSGWVVSRTLSQFYDLHRKLRPLSADIRNLELPSQSFKFLFGKSDRNSLEKAKHLIQKYLEFILEDEKLNQSEAIYSFLSPSSDHLKQTFQSPKKSKFSLSTLFKSGSESSKDSVPLRDNEDEDISQCLDAPGADTVDLLKTNGQSSKVYEDGKDTIAEPLYGLMSEIFDMRGLFKYLRKTLIAFVQVTYGRTINRQIYDTISWYFSEQMLYYYISVIMKSWWPGGEFANTYVKRSMEEKIRTELIARELFVSNVPEVLTTLVGATAAKNGAKKIFDTFQNKAMNKQLCYQLLEVVVREIFPELEFRDFF